MQTRWLIQRSLIHLVRDPFSMRVLIIQAIVSFYPPNCDLSVQVPVTVNLSVSAHGLTLRSLLLPTRNQSGRNPEHQLSHISLRYLHKRHLSLLCGQRKGSIVISQVSHLEKFSACYAFVT